MANVRRRRRRRREQARQFAVVAVASRCPTLWDQWGDEAGAEPASESEALQDGLSGGWRLSASKSTVTAEAGGCDGNRKFATTQGELRESGVAAKLRSPKRIGAMNELQVVEGDVIRVVGACNPDGSCLRRVNREPEGGQPCHDPSGGNDATTWWVGTLIASGKVRPSTTEAGVLGGGDGMGGGGLVRGSSTIGRGARGGGAVMGGWPPSDTRQRTGRFPQSIVALCRSRPPEGIRSSPASPREHARRHKCVMCGRNLSSGQRERLDRFSSSMELLRNMEAGHGVFTKKDTAGDDENLCELCLHKMVQVVKSMARNLLLKPSVGMIKTSLQAATADSQGRSNRVSILRRRTAPHEI